MSVNPVTSPPTMTGAAVRLRPVQPGDLARLTEILLTPEVARWWGTFDEAKVQAEMIEGEDDDETVVLGIEVDDRLIGLIQFLEENEPDYRSAGIDIFLDPAAHGRGHGSDAIRTLARYLFTERGHHRLTIDPAAANERAIRSYTRVGFRPVGIMRQYERGPDGTWHDGLLMDLLRDELS